MQRKKTLIVLSLLVILSPFLGLPYSFLMVLLPLLGVLILLALFVRPLRHPQKPHEASPVL